MENWRGLGRARKQGVSGGNFQLISFTDYETLIVMCYLSFIQWLLFLADVTRVRNHVFLICSVGLLFEVGFFHTRAWFLLLPY